MPGPAPFISTSGSFTPSTSGEETIATINTAGVFQARIALNALIAGDKLEIRQYVTDRATGTSRCMSMVTFNGAQPADNQIYVSPAVINGGTDSDSVKWTIKQTAGTLRAYVYSVHNQDDGKVNTTQIAGQTANAAAAVTFPATIASINSQIKKNTALAKFEFLMTDSTNHAPATGKTVTVTRSIDGAAFAAIATPGSVAELSNGIYYCDLGASDLNGNVIMLRATASGCDDMFVSFVTDV